MFNLTDPFSIVATLVAFIFGITIHEFSHAWSAMMLGDRTAEQQGRVTLNPLAHLDPLGSIGLLAIVFLGWGIGWGKPVPVNPARLKWPQRGMALTSLAGPVSNVIAALLFVIPLRLGTVHADMHGYVLLRQLVLVNILLAAFNFIPIPPLDGSKILVGFLPRFWLPYLAPIERYGVMILLGLILFGGIGAVVLQSMYLPVFDVLTRVIVGKTPL